MDNCAVYVACYFYFGFCLLTFVKNKLEIPFSRPPAILLLTSPSVISFLYIYKWNVPTVYLATHVKTQGASIIYQDWAFTVYRYEASTRTLLCGTQTFSITDPRRVRYTVYRPVQPVCWLYPRFGWA